jgi:endonuclease/exonuclease/phosphatase (EEP) superfamily protein YafD
VILLAAPGLTLAGLTLLGFAGRWWWVADLVASFRPQLTAGCLILGATLLAGRRRRSGPVVLGAGLVNLVLVAPLFFAPPGGGPLTADRLRILSFNVRASNESFAEVTAYIRRSGADVVLLHEASRPWEEALAAAELDYRVIRTRSESLIFGTLALVPPVAEVETEGFEAEAPRAVEVVVTMPSGRQVRVLGIHPLSPVTARRAAIRDDQLAYAARWAASAPAPAVVVGDLNATPWSYPFRRLARQGSLRNSQRGFGLQLSYPAGANPLLRVAIDHLLYGEGLVVLDRRLGPPLGSDHRPLVVDLGLTG